jgi:membrane protease YdiL (CAAX protease family)
MREEVAVAGEFPIKDRLPYSRSLHRLVLTFAVSFPAVMAWIYFVLLAPPAGSPAGYTALAAYGIGKLVQFSLPLAWVWVFERQRLRLAVPGFSGLTLGLGFGLVAGALIIAVYFGALRGTSYLAHTPASLSAKLEVYHATTPLRYLLLAVFLAVIHSLLEEYYWRWFVYGELRRLMGVVPGILLSSLAFTLHHTVVVAVYMPGRFWIGAVPLSLAVGVGGAAWAWLYERTGSIYACWLSHLIIDAAIMAVGFDMVFVYRS